MNKKPYLSLQFNIVIHDKQDVICASFVEPVEGEDDNNKSWWEVFGQ